MVIRLDFGKVAAFANLPWEVQRVKRKQRRICPSIDPHYDQEVCLPSPKHSQNKSSFTRLFSSYEYMVLPRFKLLRKL